MQRVLLTIRLRAETAGSSLPLLFLNPFRSLLPSPIFIQAIVNTAL